MTDDELEHMFRASFRQRAGDVTAPEGMGSVAKATTRRRQRLKVGIAGAAAVAVIAPVGVLAAMHRDGGSPLGTANSASTSTTKPGANTGGTSGTDGVPANWRVESYGGVQLRVPPDWGWGGAPMKDRGGGSFMCGDGAFAYPGPDGQTLFKESVAMPYVGRAHYYMTDVCMGLGDPSMSPKDPLVWFGSPLPVGTAQLQGGFTQSTVEVGDVRVTVLDDDPDELATILGTVEAVKSDANGCESVAHLTRPWGGLDAINHVDSVSVCVYRIGAGHRASLGYSTSIGGRPAEHLLQVLKATKTVVLNCQAGRSPSPDRVVLRFRGADGGADIEAQLDQCGGYLTAEGLRPFSHANVEPWIVDGVGLYVSGGQVGNAISRLFPAPG